jgi:predicted  nucleic acid-binding Zn-ribbon protein
MMGWPGIYQSEDEIEDLKAELAAARDARLKAENDLKSVRGSWADSVLRKEADGWRKANHEARVELADARKEIVELKAELVSELKGSENLELRLDSLQSELGNALADRSAWRALAQMYRRWYGEDHPEDPTGSNRQ